jgi:hypothetical protein
MGEGFRVQSCFFSFSRYEVPPRNAFLDARRRATLQSHDAERLEEHSQVLLGNERNEKKVKPLNPHSQLPISWPCYTAKRVK